MERRFAPYGYRLEKGELLIAEDEVDVIRTIFDRYIHTNDGVSGVAKYLNRQGFVKKAAAKRHYSRFFRQLCEKYH